MRFKAVTRRTFTARYVRSLLPPVHVAPAPGGVVLTLDLSALVSRLAMREALKQAGVRPGGV
ncbi:hypothetical protein BEN47_06090 [Hymenobacter lapidarius]|uniref:Uncharacterized protein n=1 Tax=Hymenobacter lapidarius TaxID=1908237 RepID=A0A1G1SQD0_9BACT|nr:hypothetical protein [Hymenobacter lapidarius]OGX80824.1 hypothetical protein BEN47_06090 [Hymenobacter lapidarius]